MAIVAQEFHPTKQYTNTYTEEDDEDDSFIVTTKVENQKSWTSIKGLWQSVFLPEGYPMTVSDDYLEYQIWNSLQAFSSSITGNLATHAVLTGFGVGNSTASPLSATLTWILRDGTGMLGRITFTYFKSSKLDADCKKWRLFADVLNDLAIFVDLLSPWFTRYFLYLQCGASFSRALVATAGGATRAAFTQHQARRSNLCDVSAKDASQETLVNLIALIAGLIFVPLITTSTNLIWTVFMICTFSHIFCNYKAVCAVKIEVFNLTRFAILVEHFLDSGEVLNAKEVNKKENVWIFWKTRVDVYDSLIQLGIPLEDHVDTCSTIKNLKEIYSDSEYILTLNEKKKVPVNISLYESSTATTLLEAAFHGIVALYASKCKRLGKKQFKQIIPDIDEDDDLSFLRETRFYSKKMYPIFISEAISKGWDDKRILIASQGWRILNNKVLAV